jgi:hypothetical protein
MRSTLVVAGLVLLAVAFTADPASGSSCPPTLGYSPLGTETAPGAAPSALFQPVSLGGGGGYADDRFNLRAEATVRMWTSVFLAAGLGLCDSAASGTSLGLMPALALGTLVALGTPGLSLIPQAALNRNAIDGAAYYTVPFTILLAYALNPTMQLFGGPVAQVQRYSMSGYSDSNTQLGLTAGAQSMALRLLVLHVTLTAFRNEVYDSRGGMKNEIRPTINLGARLPL